MTCPHCGAEVQPGATLCPRCGTAFHAPGRAMRIVLAVLITFGFLVLGAIGSCFLLVFPGPAQPLVQYLVGLVLIVLIALWLLSLRALFRRRRP